MTNPERPEQAESSTPADELRALSAFIDGEAPDAERAETAARIAAIPPARRQSPRIARRTMRCGRCLPPPRIKSRKSWWCVRAGVI
jgi:anti-sigma factor RsiW